MTEDTEKSSNADLAALFDPRSVAVVGASDDTRRLGGGTVLNFLIQHGYRGDIFPVNPKYETLLGRRCYRSLAEIEQPIDLAVFVVPAKHLIDAIKGVAPNHVKVALILTSGFGELDQEGAALERELIEAARARNIALVGPNSVGSINLTKGLVPTISQFFDRRDLPAGPLALVSQSGAFGTAVLAQAEREGLYFNYFVSSGNEVDLEFADFGRYLLGRDDVHVLCGYLESIRSGAGFVDLARRAAQAGKPIIVLKVGVTETGAAAARSHTGALVGSDAVAQAFFDALNIVRASDGDNLLDLLRMFERTPESRGRRLAILSHSGGAGVMAADAAVQAGVEVSPLPDDLRRRLAGLLPKFASLNNPLDMTGGASLDGKLMANCLREVLGDDAFDAALLCVNLIWREGETLMRELADIAATIRKPFAVSWVAPSKSVEEALHHAPYPVFSDPARASRTLARRLIYDDARRRLLSEPARARPFDQPAAPGFATVADQAATLAAYRVRLPRQRLARSASDAIAFQAELRQPVAMKIASRDIAHRTEIGGVVLGVSNAAAVGQAYETIMNNAKRHHPEATIDGVLCQEMVAGFEVFVGVKRDPAFGPVVAVGAGGILVELLGKPALHPAPLDKTQAERWLATSPLAPLLGGYRGGAALDLAALAAMIERISWLATDHPTVKDIDLNPVVVLPRGDGCVALDFKVVA